MKADVRKAFIDGCVAEIARLQEAIKAANRVTVDAPPRPLIKTKKDLESRKAGTDS